LGRDPREFVNDRDVVLAAIEELEPESGAPYFPELVDEGVRSAITQLAWSEDDEVSRWVFLFGDAPPFDPTFSEEATGASRRIATDALVALADAKQIRIHCVLCDTRESDRDAYETVLDQTRAFMTGLSSGTGGLMLDLSYADIRAAMLDADRTAEVTYAPVGAIRRSDVESARAAIVGDGADIARPVTIAVLPHAPLDQVTFASSSPPVKIATELRMRIKSVPGVRVAEPLSVERRYRQLRRNRNTSGLQGDALLQALGRSLGADYVLWGEVRDDGERRVTTRLVDVATAEVLAEANRASSDAIAPDQLGALLAGDVLSAAISSAAHRPLATHLAAVRDNDAQRGVITRQIAVSAAHDDLVTGLAALEKALAYSAGDAESKELLDAARARLESAATIDDDNALPRFLLAGCLFNLAKQEQMAGGDTTALMKEFARTLRAAYRFRNSLTDEHLRREIEADYTLLVRKRPAEAIPRYEALASELGTSDSARRANWMLAGIYGGDWNVGDEFVDKEKARGRLVRILAIWPDSSEAQYIEQMLRWNDQEGRTQFEHFPRDNQPLAEQIDTEA
ncbi:hypothetical protein OAS39_07210, partial [Pirellulales bacterium]|nr:hypothetical protein [Pirellulales bacterium]